MVKVGDKIRVINAWCNGDKYKNGDILTVQTVMDTGDIFAEEHTRVMASNEFEVIEKPTFKAGNRVKLIDKYYDHPEFKVRERDIRKEISKLENIVLEITDIFAGKAHYKSTPYGRYSIPVELLEPVKYPLIVGIDGMTKPTKRQWELCEISAAQRIIGEIVMGFKFGEYFYKSSESHRKLTINYTGDMLDCFHLVTAYCSPRDEYNTTIGLMVALCKATGRQLPDWVLR